MCAVLFVLLAYDLSFRKSASRAQLEKIAIMQEMGLGNLITQ